MKKLFILVLLFNAFLSNAQESFFKGNNNYQAPTIFTPTISATTVVSNISRYGASSGGTITNNGGAVITASGVCWSSISNTPTISDSKTTDGTSGGTFTSILNGLTAGVTYNVRAYATNSVGTSYGPAQTFMTTPTAIIPAVGDSYGGGIVGYVYQNGDPGYTSSNIPILITSTAPQGFTRWHNGSNVTTGATASVLGTGFTNTNSIISVQGTVTTSYAAGVARAHNGGGFTDWYLPSQDELNKLYINKSTIGGFTGTMNYFWTSTESSANTAKMQNFLSGGAITDFAKSASGGYVRAVRSVVLSPTTIPVLTTSTPASSISTTSAVVGGSVTDEGMTQVSARGFVYGTSSGSSTYSVTTGAGAGTYTSTLSGLTAGTTYFARSFATNAQGIGYGAEINFATLTTPTVSATATITSITGTTASGGGTISADGGSSVIARGIVWGTSSGSSTYSITTGTGTGTYTSSLTGLSIGTTYFVRAFARNSVGTAYGPEISFATPSTATMSSTITSTITSASAVLGGALSSIGNATTTVGIMYSTASNFGTYSTTTINTNASVGTYTTTITGLSQLTTYYAKSFATNIAGTTYGPSISFSTPVAPIAVGDFYGGGIVYYILQPGDNGYINGETHGLIAAKTTLLPDERNTSGTPNPVLYNQIALNGNSITGAQNDGTLIGRSNTAAIIANQGAGTYLFKYVNITPISGYSDWYVPSKAELILFRNFIFAGSNAMVPGPRFREDRVGAYLWVNNLDATNKYAWGVYVSSTQVTASSQSPAYRYRYATYYLEVTNQISDITHDGVSGFYANYAQQSMVILPIRSF